MKRFYKKVAVRREHERFVITLDDKDVKTPAQNLLAMPHVDLADAIIQEWDAQEDDIDPKSMPLTQLLNTQIDKAQNPALRAQMEKDLLEYLKSDLICYYAEEPESLVTRQCAVWGPLQQVFEEEMGVSLQTTSGIQYVEQNPALQQKGAEYLSMLDAEHFTVFQAVTGALGSFLIAKAFIGGHVTSHEAFEAALVDELHQAELWGDDDEASKKRETLKRELENVENYLRLVS